MKISWKSVLNIVAPLVLFVIIAYAYFPPLLEGKTLTAHDISTSTGMAKEIGDHRAATGEEALWTNSMFGGMPAYMISTRFTGNLVVYLNKILLFGARPASYLILWFASFYIMLLVLGVNPWLSFGGALVYGFTSNFFILVSAGHMTKVLTLGYVPFVIAGVILAFRERRLLGAALTGIGLSLMISANHPQMTYYTMMVVLVMGLVYFIDAIKKKLIGGYFKSVGLLVLAVVLALGANFSRLYTTYEYMKYSTRGTSELASIPSENKTSGLNRDYITDWSYGLGETFTLLIPNYRGGISGSFENHRKTETYKVLKRNGVEGFEQKSQQISAYWGPQMITSGPTYVGALVCFLFVLGMFLIKGKEKWWLVAATLMSIMLSWGKFFPFLTDMFIDYFPFYNKFRDVTMILVVAHFTMPLLAILSVKEIVSRNIPRKEFVNAFLWAFAVTGGFSLLLTLAPGLGGSFLLDQEGGYPEWLRDAVVLDRKDLLRADAIRSFALILAGALVLWFAYVGKLKWKLVYVLLALIFVFDMWPVDKRYLNDNKFVGSSKAKTTQSPTAADNFILRDKSLDYRVLNLATSTFNDASTSYYHKSIGGYHGAKMLRYNELISSVISPELQKIQQRFGTFKGDPSTIFTGLSAINMLNTKYLIYNPGAQPLPNPLKLGNAWCVPRVRMVGNADEELRAVASFDPSLEAIVDMRFSPLLEGKSTFVDSGAIIRLEEYFPNRLVYDFEAPSAQVAVFSEIYYPKGWQAFIDGKKVDHFRANYVLRAMSIPAGKHKIEFKFHPNSYFMGNKVSYASSGLLLLMVLGVVFMEVKKKK